MDPITLATAGAILLKQLLPHLSDLAAEAGTAAVKKIAGEKGRELAEAVGLLKKKVDTDPVAKALTGVLEQDPENADALKPLRDQLGNLIEKDPELRAQLLAGLDGVRIDGQGLAVLGDMQAEQIALGDGALQIRVESGNVYVMHGASRTDPLEGDTKQRDAYLRWVMEKTGFLEPAGVDTSLGDKDHRLKLGAIYTAMRTGTPRPMPKAELSEMTAGEPIAALQERNAPPLSAVELLESHHQLVLKGDPGSGKSTFVAFVALCMAGALLEDPTVHLELLTSPLPADDGSDGEQRQPWTHGALIPLRIVLRDFVTRGLSPEAKRATAKELWDFVVAELREANREGAVPLLEKALDDGEAIVLLDGLDEVPEAAKRRTLICQAVESFAKAHSKSRIVVTSRPYAYQKEFRLAGFAEAELAPFGDGQIRRFIDHWYEQVAPFKDLRPEEANGRAEDLRHAIFTSRSLHELAERPLLLTLMASLHAFRGGALPDGREKLYDETLELLLDVWERKQKRRDGRQEPSLLEFLKVERKQVLKVLQELAFDVHSQQKVSQDGERHTADVPAEKLIAALMKLPSKTGHERVDPTMLAEYLSQRSGILAERLPGIYTFPHRTFQEYLAARHLVAGRFEYDAIAKLARQDPGRWREVVLLAAAHADAITLWELADALAFTRRGTTKEKSWGLHLAAQALVETADLENPNPRNKQRLQRWRRRLAKELEVQRLPAPERALAGDHLAKLGDPRFDAKPPHLPIDERAGFVFVPAGLYPQGSTEAEIERFERDEKDEDFRSHVRSTEQPRKAAELNAFYLARYPVTVAQFRAYVEASGAEIGDRDALRGLDNHPVVRISWDEAMAYCAWLDEHLKKVATSRRRSPGSSQQAATFWQELGAGDLQVTLPSETQWEAAARGPDALFYPWGADDPTPEHANFGGQFRGTTSVGIFRRGRGPFSTEDQAGNSWDWCLDEWDAEAYEKRDGSLDPRNFDGTEAAYRVVRGGAWTLPPWDLRAAYRDGGPSGGRGGDLGFRVVLCRFPEP